MERESLGLLPLDHSQAQEFLASVPEEERSDCWWLVLRDGTLVRGDEGGGRRILTEMGLTRPIGRLLGLLPVSGAIDAFDRWLARARGRLSRFVPDGSAPVRYP